MICDINTNCCDTHFLDNHYVRLTYQTLILSCFFLNSEYFRDLDLCLNTKHVCTNNICHIERKKNCFIHLLWTAQTPLNHYVSCIITGWSQLAIKAGGKYCN